MVNQQHKRFSVNKLWKDIPYRYEPKHPLHLMPKDCSLINKVFNRILTDRLIETGYSFKAPNLIGEFYIGRKKRKRNPVDFNATKIYGRTIKFENPHSDGWCPKFIWRKKTVKFVNATKWAFNPVATTRRKKLKEASKDVYKYVICK